MQTSPAFLFAIFLIATSSCALAEDWPHYLGPHADTSIREAGIATTFPETGLPLVWKQPAGGGYSGPAIADGRVFIMDRIAEPYEPGKIEGNPNFIRAQIPGTERVRALDATTGKTLWSHSYDCPYSTVFIYAIGPRCTPTVDGDRVYTLGAEGNLICFSVTDGKIHWSRDFKQDYKLEIAEWGCAAHPLIHGDQLICVVGGDGSTVVSFNKHTGEESWRGLTASKPGYCPPVLARIHDREQVLIWHGDAVVALDPDKGTKLWSVEIKPSYGMSIGAPRVFKDLVFVMGFNGVSGAIKVGPDSRSAELIWGKDRRIGVAGVFNTAHLDESGHLYSCGRKEMFRCTHIETGDRLWESDRPLKSADGTKGGYWASAFSFHHPPSGHTFLYNDHGELISTKLAPSGYTEISRIKLIDPTHKVGNRTLVWSSPAFANRKIFVRNDKEVRCYDFSKR